MRNTIRITLSMAMTAVIAATLPCAAAWHTILSDDFNGATAPGWDYAGVTNGAGDPLFRHDPGSGRITAEWDQTNLVVNAGDPYIILPSRLARSLGRTFTDFDTFRVRATLLIEPGSIVDTEEYFQIGNIGLYNLAEMGPDRAMVDWGNGNSNMVKDACDFIDFCYFINNDDWSGPNITAVMGTHIEGTEGYYIAGTPYTQTAMGKDNHLPEGTPLYVELLYHGAETGALARCAQSFVYSDAARSNLVVVNGATMRYTTDPLAPDLHFTVRDVAFYNYVASPWFDTPGHAFGAFDDVSVDYWVPEGALMEQKVAGNEVVTTWDATPGETYYVLNSSNLVDGVWVTNEIIVASGDSISVTGGVETLKGFYRVDR